MYVCARVDYRCQLFSLHLHAFFYLQFMFLVPIFLYIVIQVVL